MNKALGALLRERVTSVFCLSDWLKARNGSQWTASFTRFRFCTKDNEYFDSAVFMVFLSDYKLVLRN